MIPLLILTIEDEDDRAFAEALYHRFERLIYSEIYKILKDHWSTEDTLQTVLVKLILNLSYLRTLNRDNLVNYIIKVARNTAYSHIRKESRQRCLPLIENLDSPDDEECYLDYPMLQFENRELLMSAWKALDKRSQILLEMKYQLEKSNAEIAETFGVSEANIRALLSQARKKVRENLGL